MASPPESQHSSGYSSRLTRRLAQEAEYIFDSDSLNSEELDAQFEKLSADAKASLESNKQIDDELIHLASLIDQSGENIGIDGSFSLILSDDKMELAVDITPAIGKSEPVTTKRILDELHSRDIKRGVMMSAVKQAVQQAESGQKVTGVVIVRGSAPIPGVGAWVAYFGRQPGGDLEEVNESALVVGSDEAVLCQNGDTIAYLRQGDSGLPGYTASGEPIAPPPAPPALCVKAGRNVIATGDFFIAEIDGAVTLEDNRVSVQPALVYYRDIEPEDGPIEFDGAIFIHGGVKTGSQITATEDIVIDRVVEGAQVTSTTGNVTLQAGIAGRNCGSIHAAGDVICGFVENAIVTAGGNIVLHVGALNSQLTANIDLLAEEGRGGLTGGVIMAGRSIRAKRLGSCGAKTTVMTGLQPDAIPKLENINQQMLRLQDKQDEAIDLIAQFDRAVRDPSQLTEQEQKVYISLHKLKLVVKHQIEELQASRTELLETACYDAPGAVIVYQKLDANVTVHIGQYVGTPRMAKGPLTFTRSRDNTKMSCLRKISPPIDPPSDINKPRECHDHLPASDQ